MEQDLFRSFAAFVKAHQMFNQNDTVVTGVSGGADSVALLLLLRQLQNQMPFSLLAVHVNHGIRGSEAEEDEAFVRRFCEMRNIPCETERVSVPEVCSRTGESEEECARRLRYEILCRKAKKRGAKIAVAHHRDDNAETVLFHLIRGSGLKGLSGMQPVSRMNGCVLLRPLLSQSRAEIEAFLEAEQIPFRTDSTNLDLSYARNAIRGSVLPALTEINEKAAEHILRSAQILKEAEDFLEKETEKEWQTAAQRTSDGIRLSIPKLQSLDPALLKRVLLKSIASACGSSKDVTARHVEQTAHLMSLQSGRKIMLPGGLVARRQYDEIVIGPQSRELPKATWERKIRKDLLNADAMTVDLPEGRQLRLWLVPVTDENRAKLVEKNRYTKAFDYDKIKNDIIVGAKAPGDFIALQNGRKSIKKFFIDEKVPADQRGRTVLVKDGTEVLWIAGFRISETCKITAETKTSLLIQLIGGDHEC